MCHENYAQCKIYVYVSTDSTADAEHFLIDTCSLHIDIRKERTESLNAYQTLFR